MCAPLKNYSRLGDMPWLKYWIYAITLVCLMLAVLVCDDFGITWDESVQSRYGELVLSYFKSGGADVRCNQFLNLKFYGPLFELTCAISYDYFPEKKFEIRHLCIAIMAVLTIPGLIKFSQLYRDPLVPFFTSLSLVMSPRYFGHGFNNSKDIPFACCFVWAMYFIAKFFTQSLQRSRALWLSCGVAIGLALSIRIGGMVLFFYYILVSAFVYTIRNWQSTLSQTVLPRMSWLKPTVSIFAVSWCILILFWPWAHDNIIVNPIKAFTESTNFGFHHSVLFDGRTLKSNGLPWYYLIKYLLITTPPTLMILALIGILSSFTMYIKRSYRNSILCFLTQIWFFFPLVYFVIKRPNVYDGIRHFLFVLPSIAIFTGLGATQVYRRFQSYLPAKILFCLMLGLILVPIKDVVSLHPYQMTYFNGAVGGVTQAQKKYDTDYWVSSYKEAAEWINK